MLEQRKLLLADDSITIQKVINLTFADEGIQVTAVGNGEAAIERLPEIAPDLVLADVHMPGLNGYEVCERIRNTPEFQNVPVMLLVGSFEPFDENEAQRVGANDYLTKPFQSIKQLVNKVHGLLDQSSQEAAGAVGAEVQNHEAALFEDTPVVEKEQFANENSNLLELDIPLDGGGGRSFAFGEAEFDDELIDATPGSKVEKAQSDTEFEQSQNLQAENYQSGENALLKVDPETEWQIVESDLQTQSSHQTEENFLETASVVELYPEMIELEPAENSASQFKENFAVENQNQQLTENLSANENDLFVIDFETSEAPEFARYETANEPLELEEENRAIAPEAAATQQPQTFQTSEISESFQNAPVMEDENSGFAAFTEQRQQYVTDGQTIADPPATNVQAVDAVKPFIAPIFDDDEFLLDIQFDAPEAATTITTAAAEETAEMLVEPIVPEIVEPSNENSTQELTLVNQQTDLEKSPEANDARMMQFSPEVIDAIAQRVVEKLSDKVIEKIAWEIVPDRFDLIVRKTIQNKDSER